MTENIFAYMVVEASNASALAEEVNKQLGEGWLIHGNITVCQSWAGENIRAVRRFYQVLVKKS